jgi:hypothetical protein
MAQAPNLHNRIRNDPRISANDLARYMVSTETGKIGIITRSKEPSTAPVIRYNDLRSGLKAALCDPAAERKILGSLKTSLEQKSDDMSLSAFARDDAQKSLDALECLPLMRNELSGFDYKPAPSKQNNLFISGVNVSVNCDLLIHREYRGSEEIGAVLFRFTKPDEEESDSANSKRKEMGSYAATLVHMQVAANMASNRIPSYKLCWSVDMQHRERHVAPKNYRQKAMNIENACRFIAAMWGGL